MRYQRALLTAAAALMLSATPRWSQGGMRGRGGMMAMHEAMMKRRPPTHD
jgi:hypothetical protein